MLHRSALPARERALYSKLRQILDSPGILLGSLVEMRRSCGKEGCRCERAARHRHRSLYLAVRTDRRRRMIYVAPEWEERVGEWVRRCKEIREVLEQLSDACVHRLQTREM